MGLSSSNSIVTVPANVTVVSGASTASFTITANQGSSQVIVTITATANGTATTTFTDNTSSHIALQLNPGSLVGGMSSTNNKVLIPLPAGSGGAVVNLSSSSPNAVVPASVTVPSGFENTPFTITTSPVAANTSITITATYGSYSATKTLTVTAPTLTGVTLSPTTVVGGVSSTATVAISNPAPTGGLAVALSSNNTAAATVPASVTVPGGSTSATVTVTTSPVLSTATAVITATLNSATSTATLLVSPPILSALSIAPGSVISGTNATGTVTISGPAPTGGFAVSLSSSNASAAAVPATATIPAGATTANFTISSVGVSSTTTATITAVAGAQSYSANLTVSPNTVTVVSLSPTTVGPGGVSTGTVTLASPAPSNGTVVTLSSSNTAVATVPASVTVAAGLSSSSFVIEVPVTSPASVVTISATAGGQTATAPLTVAALAVVGVSANPSAVVGPATATGTVTLNGTAPSGGFLVTLSSSNSIVTVPATVTVASGASSASFTITAGSGSSQVIVTITASGNGTATTPFTDNTSSHIAIQLNPSTLVGGTSSTSNKVLIPLPAGTGGAIVNLSSNNANAVVPASVTVPVGLENTAFTITTSAVAANANITITATYGSYSANKTLAVTAPTLTGIVLSPTSVVGGTSSAATVSISSPAPTGGLPIAMTSSNTAAATVPSVLTIPGGSTSAMATVTTFPVSATASPIITATLNSASSTATLTVNAPTLTSLAIAPGSVVSGTNATGTVSISSSAPSSGFVVALSSSDTTVATVPSTATIPSGATSVAFTITSQPVGSTSTCTISGAESGQSVSRNLTVTPSTAAAFYPINIVPNPPLGYLPTSMTLPNWMSALEPVDASSAPGGPSAAISENLAFGVIQVDTGADVDVANSAGSDVIFSRKYRTAMAAGNLSSPGLPAGWTHNWDYWIVPQTPGSWGPLQLVYPNGSSETLTPPSQVTAGTVVQFTTPNGAPYKAFGQASSTVGVYTQIQLAHSGLAQDIFAQPSGDGRYRLQTEIEDNGSQLNLHYSSVSGQIEPVLSSIDNSVTGSSSTPLLVLSYSGGLLSSVTDNASMNTRTLGYVSGQLSTVSFVNGSNAEWSYSYTPIGSASYLWKVSTVDPQNAASTATITYSTETGQVLSRTDGTNYVRSSSHTAAGAGALSIADASGNSIDSFSITSEPAFNRIATTTTAAGDTTSYSYSSGSLAIPSTVIPPQGNAISITTDSHGNPTKVVYPYGNFTTYAWSYPAYAPLGLLTSNQESGNDLTTLTATTYTYYSASGSGGLLGYLHTVTTPTGNIITFTYTSMGDIASVADSTGTTNYDYSSTGPEMFGRPYSVTSPTLAVTKFQYDPQLRLINTTDPLTNQTSQQYNEYNQLVQMSLPTGLSYQFSHLVDGQPSNSTVVSQNGTQLTVAANKFDSQAQLTTSKDANLLSNVSTLDGNSALTSLINGNNNLMHSFTISPSARTIKTVYGSGANLLTQTDTLGPTGSLISSLGREDNRSTNISYSSTDPDLPLSATVFDPATNWLNESDVLNYDSFGRITDIESIAPDGGSYVEHNYTFDSTGSLTSDLTTPIVLASGLLSSGTGPTNISYTYNADGTRSQMLVILQPWSVSSLPNVASVTYNYLYDAAKRVTSIYVYPGSTDVAVSSGQPLAYATYEYDPNGRVKAVRSMKATTLYAYNALGQITSELNLSVDGTVDPYAPAGYSFTESSGVVHTIISAFTNITYDMLGDRTGMTFAALTQPGSSTTGLSTYGTGSATWGYDNGGRLISENWADAAYTGIAFTHTYDGGGNLTQIRNHSLTVDPLSDRLTSANLAGYSSLGFDTTGEMTQFNGNTATYDPLGELSSLSGTSAGGGSQAFSASMVYDHLGRRSGLSQSIGGGSAPKDTQFFVYDGADLIYRQLATYPLTQLSQPDFPTGDTGVLYLYGPTGLIMEFDRFGYSARTLLFDPNGSCVSSAENYYSSGAFQGSTAYPVFYDAYGQVVWTPPALTGPAVLNRATSQPFQYKGQFGCYTDGTSGLVYCTHRYYDPVTGRWTERDPVGLDGGVNVYAYCDDNPVSLVDDCGLWPGEFDFSAKGILNGLATGYAAVESQGQDLFAAIPLQGNLPGLPSPIQSAMKAYASYLRDSVDPHGLETSDHLAATGFTFFEIAAGGGVGASQLRGRGLEFSHFVPKWFGGVVERRGYVALGRAIKGRSMWNGNFVSRIEHAFTDGNSYRFMPRKWKILNPDSYSLQKKILTRIPNTWKGAIIGGAGGQLGTYWP